MKLTPAQLGAIEDDAPLPDSLAQLVRDRYTDPGALPEGALDSIDIEEATGNLAGLLPAASVVVRLRWTIEYQDVGEVGFEHMVIAPDGRVVLSDTFLGED